MLKDQEKGKDSMKVSPKWENFVLKIINDLVQRDHVNPEVDGEMTLPLVLKPIAETSSWNVALHEVQKETNEEDIDKDYIFKFMDESICKSMKRGFQDMIQCQNILQETQLRNKKQVGDMEMHMHLHIK